MTQKYVTVTFSKHKQLEVIARVESDLSGEELEYAVVVPHEWMQQLFGDEWQRWQVVAVTEINEKWAILKGRTDALFQKELDEAPLFEVADDKEDVK